MNTLEPNENVDRDAYLATRLPVHEMRLDRTIAGGRITVEGYAKGVLTPGDAMQIEVLFDGEVQNRSTGRALISADVELGLIVFYRFDKDDGAKIELNPETHNPRRFAALGKVEIRRRK